MTRARAEQSVAAACADDVACFLSPSLFARLSLAYLERWYDEAFPDHSERHLHLCGPTDHVHGLLSRLHLTSFDMGEMVDVRKAIDSLPGTNLLRIADFRLIRDATQGAIEAYVREQVALAAGATRFTLHVEGWRGVPLWKPRLVKDTLEACADSCGPSAPFDRRSWPDPEARAGLTTPARGQNARGGR